MQPRTQATGSTGLQNIELKIAVEEAAERRLFLLPRDNAEFWWCSYNGGGG
jgi:hypothetical protein